MKIPDTFMRARWVIGLVMLIALIVRIPGLGSFMTVDEEKWMVRSGLYWHKIFRDGDVGGAFVTTHPGATLTWLAGAGIFAQETRLGFDIDTSNLEYFRKAAVWPVMTAIVLLIGVSVWLLSRLFGRRVAWWSGLLLASEPYLAGMSQVAHVDMLLSMFMLVAVLAFLVNQIDGRIRWWIISGTAGGLAMATKLLPSLWLFVFMAIVLIWRVLAGERSWREAMRLWWFVLGMSVVVFYAAWPALWVKHGLDAYYQRDVVNIVTVDHGAGAKSAAGPASNGFYARTIVGRLTIFTWLVALGTILATARNIFETKLLARSIAREDIRLALKKSGMHVWAQSLLWLILYGVGFLAMISLAAKKSDRYALPALVLGPVLAGVGVGLAWLVIRKKWPEKKKVWKGVGGGLAVLIVWQALAWSPYAIAFNGPFKVRPMTQQGWGEGLDQVGAWLNRHPLADRLVIASWYPGVTRTYFKGTTMSLSSRDDDRVGYVVTYRNMYGREPDDVASNVLDEFRDKKPVYVVEIQGEPYAWVYEQLGLYYYPLHAGELVGDMEVGQVVQVDRDNWESIDIGMATFSGRNNNKEVILHVRENIDSQVDLRTVRVKAEDIADSDWHKFRFDPIEGSRGKKYFVSLTSPASVKGNAVTVKFVDRDIRAGEMVLRRRAFKDGETNRDFIRNGDMAYRL